jgi:hypothetical protein
VTEEGPLRAALAVAGGAAALIAALLGALQVDASRKSERAAAEGSRLAVEIFADLTSTGLRLNLELAIIREQAESALDAEAVLIYARGGRRSDLNAVARADRRVASRLERAGEAMIGKPLGFESVPTLIGEQAELERGARAKVARQNAMIVEAERLGRRSGLAARGLLLVAVAGALLTLAGSIRDRRPAWLAFGTAVAILVGSVATGGYALLA